jgi:DNA-binding transcriptional ArsR family regulator
MIADATRSRMLAFLLDGQYACAGELAVAASVQPSTASAHLNKLVRAGLVVCEPRGRHRYFRLADGEVAQALQALALVAERGTHECAWSRPGRQRLREARCCYGHLAGRLGVALWDALRREGRSRGAPHEVELTAIGRQWLAEALEFDASAVRPSVRLGYGCLDWSERRDHLAGALAR